MYASYIGHDNIANLLLEAGVDVNATTPKGLTTLMLAASCGNESIAYFLLQVQTAARGETTSSGGNTLPPVNNNNNTPFKSIFKSRDG